MSDEGMSDEMLAVARKDISSSGDFGEVAAHVAAALIARLDAAERDRDALREALGAMLLMHDAGGVTLGAAKDARAALTANHSAPVVEE